MQREVSIDLDQQLIRARFSSISTVEDWRSSLEEVRRLSEETGICRVLVDVRKQTNLADTMELFDFARNLPRSLVYAVLCEINIGDHQLHRKYC